MTVRGDRGRQVYPVHNPAALHIAKHVGIVGQYQFCHLDYRFRG
jgi:hypothetical protein